MTTAEMPTAAESAPANSGFTADHLWDLVTTKPMPEGVVGYELIAGELKEVCPSGGEHGGIAGNFAAFVGYHVLTNGLGRIYTAEAGFIVSSGNVLAPDLGFVTSARLGSIAERRKFVPFAPDLAVEVVSPSDPPSRVWSKVALYLEGGTRAVWVVWPQTRDITVVNADGVPKMLGADDWLEGGDLLPGFRERVGQFFPDE